MGMRDHLRVLDDHIERVSRNMSWVGETHLRVLDDHIERVIARGCCGYERPSKGAR